MELHSVKKWSLSGFPRVLLGSLYGLYKGIPLRGSFKGSIGFRVEGFRI